MIKKKNNKKKPRFLGKSFWDEKNKRTEIVHLLIYTAEVTLRIKQSKLQYSSFISTCTLHVTCTLKF